MFSFATFPAQNGKMENIFFGKTCSLPPTRDTSLLLFHLSIVASVDSLLKIRHHLLHLVLGIGVHKLALP